MTALRKSLRVQLALLGFAAMYAPVLVLFTVSVATDETVIESRSAGTLQSRESHGPSAWVVATLVALAPAAGALAWSLAGRAVRPIEQVRSVAEEIEAADLSRRIGLQGGPAEVVALAASFDAMLDRLEEAAGAQRRLVEEISHDLRTPLSVLATGAEVLLAHPEPTTELYREGLERSRAAAHRLQSTIDELLVDARGRARTLDRRPADLVEIAAAAVDDARRLAEANGATLRLTAPASAVCAIDEATMRRAVGNLLDNAIRHAPGSPVAVKVEQTAMESILTVTDHGPGIPADLQPRIFDRFWRGDGDRAGSGLGLPIAKQVALAHGGDLTVDSPGPDGVGAVFTLRLRR